jgi:cobalt-zinc-cadmium resistance protein CzcA
LISTALGGEPIGTFFEDQQRFSIVARFDQGRITSPEAIGSLPVYSRAGVPIPLEQVADLSFQEAPTIIARDNGRRRITVCCDIASEDERSFVAEAQRRIAAEIDVPPGYRVRWIGLFENIKRTREQFAWLIPLTIALVYGSLVLAFRSHRESLAVLLTIPASFLCAAVALHCREMSLNASSVVGFVLLCGMSVIGSIMIVQWIDTLRRQGIPRDAAIVEGAVHRTRPVLMASLATILGLFPASIARGLGSDLQRPLACVIVWGLVGAMFWTIFVLPVLYQVLASKHIPVDPHAADQLPQDAA